MSLERKTLGKYGEQLVVAYLEKKGYQILEKNYLQKFGEIDLIAQYKETIAFIEVKLRRNPKFYVSELILPSKQKKIIKTALYYIAQRQLSELIYRFDVALLESEYKDYRITYIENAFSASSQ